MNVYTHVAMADLHDDVESLAGLATNGGAGSEAAELGTPADTPDDLAGLISSWNDLPDNVRSAIAALANT